MIAKFAESWMHSGLPVLVDWGAKYRSPIIGELLYPTLSRRCRRLPTFSLPPRKPSTEISIQNCIYMICPNY